MSSRLASPRLASPARLARSALLALSAVMPAGSALAAPQQWVEFPVSPVTSLVHPQDCATSPDYRRAAVRYAHPTDNSTVVSIYQLTGSGLPGGSLRTFGGGSLKSGEPINLSGFLGYRPSDLIELTNEWGVSIGTGRSSTSSAIDETYIEAFNVDAPTASSATIVQFVVSPNVNNPDATHAGYAHDVAITRDAKWAVVNSANWIHMLELVDPNTMPPTVNYTGFNIGAFAAGPCNPNGAVDSVAVSNEYAVVTTARPNSSFNGAPTTWVYIVDLTPTTGPAIVLEQEITPPHGFPLNESNDDAPHDVAITPSRDGGGTRAVVTTRHATAFFDLPNAVLMTAHFNSAIRRGYQVQVDSVELTGKTAVTIADDVSGASPAWVVSLYDVLTGGHVVTHVDPNPPSGSGSRAHDLAIDWDFDKGIVRTSFSNVVLNTLTTAAAPTVLASPNGSSAYSYQDYSVAYNAPVFSSDSVALGIEQGGVLRGATIGGTRDPVTFLFSGRVDLIDLSTSPATLNQVVIQPDSNDLAYGCVPNDVAIAFNQTDVIVRSTDLFSQAPNSVGPDLSQISLATGAIINSWGGNGSCFSTDSLAVPSVSGFANSVRRMLSISHNPTPSAASVEYTHVSH